MTKTISVEEINRLYKKLGLDEGRDFDVRMDINTGTLGNRLNRGTAFESARQYSAHAYSQVGKQVDCI